MTHAESWSITPTAAHGRKAPTNNCKKYIGQNKSGKSGLCLATQPYIANFLPVLSSVDIDKAPLKGLKESVITRPPGCDHSAVAS